MLKKIVIKEVTFDKKKIAKLKKNPQEFMKQFNLGNIAMEDYLEFREPAPVFNQAEVFDACSRISMEIKREEKWNKSYLGRLVNYVKIKIIHFCAKKR